MEVESERPDVVRCLSCHAVYEQAAASTRPEATATCPECGDVAWLAASIPIEESRAVVPP